VPRLTRPTLRQQTSHRGSRRTDIQPYPGYPRNSARRSRGSGQVPASTCCGFRFRTAAVVRCWRRARRSRTARPAGSAPCGGTVTRVATSRRPPSGLRCGYPPPPPGRSGAAPRRRGGCGNSGCAGFARGLRGTVSPGGGEGATAEEAAGEPHLRIPYVPGY